MLSSLEGRAGNQQCYVVKDGRSGSYAARQRKMLSYTTIFCLACAMADPNPSIDPNGSSSPMVTANIVNIRAQQCWGHGEHGCRR